MSDRLRLAVIGAGMGRYGLLPAFLRDERIEVVSVCASRKETADKFAQQYQVPHACVSWQALLQQEVDLVAVATPPAIQAEITQAFLQKKIPLFLEKQISLNRAQSQALCQLAEENQVLTGVNFIFPYLHTWQRLYTLLKKGSVGQIRQVFLNWRMESYDNRHHNSKIWKTNDAEGGGVLQHFLSHSFHYLEHFFGEIKELGCTLGGAPDLHAGGSVFASLDLVFASNVIGHVAAGSAAYAGPGHSLEIYGSEGSLILKNEAQDPVRGFNLFYAPRGKGMELIASEESHLLSSDEDSRVSPTAILAKAFVDSIRGEKIQHPTIREAHRVQVLLNLANLANAKRCFVPVG